MEKEDKPSWREGTNIVEWDSISWLTSRAKYQFITMFALENLSFSQNSSVFSSFYLKKKSPLSSHHDSTGHMMEGRKMLPKIYSQAIALGPARKWKFLPCWSVLGIASNQLTSVEVDENVIYVSLKSTEICSYIFHLTVAQGCPGMWSDSMLIKLYLCLLYSPKEHNLQLIDASTCLSIPTSLLHFLTPTSHTCYYLQQEI